VKSVATITAVAVRCDSLPVDIRMLSFQQQGSISGFCPRRMLHARTLRRMAPLPARVEVRLLSCGEAYSREDRSSTSELPLRGSPFECIRMSFCALSLLSAAGRSRHSRADATAREEDSAAKGRVFESANTIAACAVLFLSLSLCRCRPPSALSPRKQPAKRPTLDWPSGAPHAAERAGRRKPPSCALHLCVPFACLPAFPRSAALPLFFLFFFLVVPPSHLDSQKKGSRAVAASGASAGLSTNATAAAPWLSGAACGKSHARPRVQPQWSAQPPLRTSFSSGHSSVLKWQRA
jgi:hypothetical protein